MGEAKRKAASRRVCVYCGAVGKMSSDHVPPRAWLLKPYPEVGVITVPACQSCNERHSSDEELFRPYLSTLVGLETWQGSEFWATKAFPGLQKNLKLKRTFLNAPRMWMRQPGKMFEEVGVLHLDAALYHRMIERLVRALYWRRTGNVMGSETRVISRPWKGDDAQLREVFGPAPGDQVGGNFVYRYWMHPADMETSAWMFLFHGSHYAIAFAGEVADLPPDEVFVAAHGG